MKTCYFNCYKFYLSLLLLFCWLWLLTISPCYAEDTQPLPTNTSSVVISENELQKLATVINAIRNYYVHDVSEEKLFDNAISGMLNGLDPHSEYLKDDDLDVLEMVTSGKFGGIGVEVVPEQGLIKVISPLDDSPASKAGIKAGDFIVKIDDKLVQDLQLHEAIKLMRGEKNTLLTLSIVRENSPKPLEFKIKREIIHLQAVKSKMLNKYVGYLRIAFFQEDTNLQVVKAINNFKKNNLKGLIIDLRNNPGGLLDSAVQVADNFLDSAKLNNDTIVFTKGKNNAMSITSRATKGELIPKIPIVILINTGSASASEVVTGALQDYKRAIVLGTKSFGKGSVQTILPINENTAIKLTTALYYTPLGRSIQATGIVPDIVVEDNAMIIDDNKDSQLNVDESNLLTHLPNSIAIQKNQQQIPQNTLKEYNSIDDTIKQDYQLYEALHVLQAMMYFN